MRILLMTTFIVVLASCHQPVEYGVTAQSGVVKLRVSDNTIVGNVSNIPDGRSLCSQGNTEFLVASGSGVLYRFNSLEMVQDTSYSIGSSSGSGYGEIILPDPTSAYKLVQQAGSSRLISSRTALLTNSLRDHSRTRYAPHLPVRGFTSQTAAIGRSER